MSQLSKSFSLLEMVSSETATRKNINNSPTPEVVSNLRALAVNVLQPLRDWYGKPINITSGYRSPALNRAIGGSSSSYHSFGKAADFTVYPADYKRVFKYIQDNLPFSELIWEFGDDNAPRWIHVAYDPKKLDKEILRATKNMLGRTVYSKFRV